MGNLMETEDPTHRVFYSRYDVLNRVVETGMRSPMEPEKNIVLTTTAYDITNHQVTETDAVNGGSITTAYDEAESHPVPKYFLPVKHYNCI